MVYIAIKRGRGKTKYCAIVRATKGGSGVPNQRETLHMTSLIRAQKPCNKRISRKKAKREMEGYTYICIFMYM